MLWFLINRIFGSKGDTTGTDDDHDEQIKVTKIDDKMTEPPNSENKKERKDEIASVKWKENKCYGAEFCIKMTNNSLRKHAYLNILKISPPKNLKVFR